MSERRDERQRGVRDSQNEVERCTQWVAVEVRYSDLDAQGHVNNAVFLTYFEQARVAFLAEARARGLATESERESVATWAEERTAPGRIEASDIPYVIANASCAYIRPVASLAPVAVGVYCSEGSRASFELRYVVSDEAKTVVYATGTTLIVNVDPATGRLRSLPTWLRGGLLARDA